MPTKSKNKKTLETLQRIQKIAREKAQAGVKEHRAKLKRNPVDEAVRSIQIALGGATPKATSRVAARELVDSLNDTFEELLHDFRTNVISQLQYPNSYRDRDGEVLLYPDGCRFLHVGDNGSGVMVVEEQPGPRTLLIGRKQRRVSLPYVVFVIFFQDRGHFHRLQEFSIGFRTTPLTRVSDRLYCPTLPNFSGHNVCMYVEEPEHASLTELAAEVQGTFWQSMFGDGFPSFRVNNDYVDSWGKWEKLTEKNPLFALHGTFPSGATIQELTQNVVVNRELRTQVERYISQAWQKVMRQLNTDDAAEVIEEATRKVLKQILQDTALQQKKS